LKAKNRPGIFLANPPLSDYFRKAEKAGISLNAAVVLGVHSSELLAAAITLKEGERDKLHLAGGLAGRSLLLAPAKTVDLLVSAKAEIFLEGHLLYGIREKEGPFGESSGYYFRGENPVMEVNTVTFRNNPIIPVIQPRAMETDIILSIFTGAEIYQELSKLVPGVLNVAFLPGALTFQAVIQVADGCLRQRYVS